MHSSNLVLTIVFLKYIKIGVFSTQLFSTNYQGKNNDSQKKGQLQQNHSNTDHSAISAAYMKQRIFCRLGLLVWRAAQITPFSQVLTISFHKSVNDFKKTNVIKKKVFKRTKAKYLPACLMSRKDPYGTSTFAKWWKPHGQERTLEICLGSLSILLLDSSCSHKSLSSSYYH